MSTKIFVIQLLSLVILLSLCPHKDYGALKFVLTKAFSVRTLFAVSSNAKTSNVDDIHFILVFGEKKDNIG